MKPVQLTPLLRRQLIERIVGENIKVAQACRELGVSRVTAYKWLRRFNQTRPEKISSAFERKADPAARIKFRVNPEHENVILTLVKEFPDLSKYKLADKVRQVLGPVVGVEGVYGVLLRNSLNTPQTRLTYARQFIHQPQPAPVAVVSEGRVRSVFPAFTPQLVPAPPPKFAWSGLLRLAGISTGATVMIVLLVRLLLRTWIVAGASTPGILVAVIALGCGMIFFLYSLKYYLTIGMVLSFSQSELGTLLTSSGLDKRQSGWLARLLGGDESKEKVVAAVGMKASLEAVVVQKYPFVSVHIPFYNEKKVVERAMGAALAFDYPEYEVILADDSTDETSRIIQNYMIRQGSVHSTQHSGYQVAEVEVRPGVVLKHIHRINREGYKGGALALALQHTHPNAQYVSVFDADFVPYPDTLIQFVKYFQLVESNVAAVQGYQWHVLNKSENWITRGVRTEYSGSYVIERAGAELYGGLKQISGSVYMIKKQILQSIGWGASITEDFELTLKLYAQGYKVLYTPYIQAPSECVSTLKRLIRQRMRWAEGHSHNVRNMSWALFSSSHLTTTEKLEFAYLAPYYLQAALFLMGTLAWLVSEAILHTKLPFWTSLWGWSLVLSNLLALPLMNGVGVFLEEGERRDYGGLFSFIALSYLVVPFQAYAAIKGFIEKEEGPWFRTPKTGVVTDVLRRGSFYRWLTEVVKGKKAAVKVAGVVNVSVPKVPWGRKQSRWFTRAVVATTTITTMLVSSSARTISLASNEALSKTSKSLNLLSGPPSAEAAIHTEAKAKLFQVEETSPEKTPDKFFLKDRQGKYAPYILEHDQDGKIVEQRTKKGVQRFDFRRHELGIGIFYKEDGKSEFASSVKAVPVFEYYTAGSWKELFFDGNSSGLTSREHEGMVTVIAKHTMLDDKKIKVGNAEIEVILGFAKNTPLNKWTFNFAGTDKSALYRMRWIVTSYGSTSVNDLTLNADDFTGPMQIINSDNSSEFVFYPEGIAGKFTIDPTLSITTAAATITVTSNQTPSWKAVWDSSKGGTIDEFYTPSDSATNIVEDDTTNQREQNLFNIRLAVSAGTNDSTAVSDASVALTLLEYTDVRIKIRVEGELETDGAAVVNGWYQQDYTVYPDRIVAEGWAYWRNASAATIFEHSFNFEPATFTNNGTATDVYLGDNNTAMAAFATGTTWRTATNVTYEAPGPVAVMQMDSSNTDISVWATQIPFQVAQDDEYYWENGASFDRFAWGGDSVSITQAEVVAFGSVMKITADNTSDGSEGRLYALDYWTPDDLTFSTGSAWDSVEEESGKRWDRVWFLVFGDGFETGDTTRWTSETDTGSNFNVNTTSVNTGTNGAQVTVGATVAYVTDGTPTSGLGNPARFRVRFYLDPNTITMATNDEFTILADNATSGSENFSVRLNYDGANYRTRACLENDANGDECTGYVNLNDAYNLIEADWGFINTDGYVRIWVNGVFGAEDALVDAGTESTSNVRWGNVVGRDAGTSGSIFLDDLKWTYNSSYLGSASFDFHDGAYSAAASSDQVNLDIDGNTATRYQPAFKVKNYRLATDPSSVTLEGTGLVDGTDYNVAMKPVSSAYFAQDITWASSLESAAAITSPDIGTAGAVGSSSAILPGRNGSGIDCSGSTNRYYNFPISGNFDIAKGAVEFWYRPAWDYGSTSTFTLLNETNGDFILRYDGVGQDLRAEINQDGNGLGIDTVLTASALWAAFEWVHIRLEWDDSAATADQLRIFVDGIEPSHTDDTDDFDSTQVTGLGADMGIGGDVLDAKCNGIFDEFKVYDFNGTGNNAGMTKLADGGDPADTDEYLNDAANDFTFSLAAVDASNRGEYLYFGTDEKFAGLNIDLATLGVGTSLDLGWEYWDGATWSSLESVSGFTDGTSNFTADGVVSWNLIPSFWDHYSVNGSADMYFIRVHLEGGSYSTNPIEDDIVTDILLFQYLSNISSAAQTLIIVPENIVLFAPIIVGMVYFSRRGRKKK